MNPFQIYGRDIKKRNVSTTEKPHLYAITSGQRNAGTGGSLIFHVKIGDTYHQLNWCKTHKNSVAVKCTGSRSTAKVCKARHKFKVDPRFVHTKVGGVNLKNGKKRDSFHLDFADPQIRKVEHWQVLSHATVILTSVRPRFGIRSEKTSASATQPRPWSHWKVIIIRRWTT